MSDRTAIEWCTSTWNPVTGCSPVSEGCANCYAVRNAWRLAHNPHRSVAQRYAGTVEQVDGRLRWTGKVNVCPDMLDKPLHWRKPRLIFLCSMGDLLHDDVPRSVIRQVLVVCGLCPQHRFLILTKRPARLASIMDELVAEGDFFEDHWLSGDNPHPYLPNVWLGVTVENGRYLDRIEQLLRIPAGVHVVSIEPMLGSVALPPEWLKPVHRQYFDIEIYETPILSAPRLDWVICGGETGPGARPMHPDCARGLRDQCVTAGVPFFFKHWGEYLAREDAIQILGEDAPVFRDCAAGRIRRRARRGQITICQNTTMVRVGKKAAGRLLDGREWNEMPPVAADGTS